MKRIILRTIGTIVLLGLMFEAGLCWRDLRGVHDIYSFYNALGLIRMDMTSTSLMAARGEPANDLPYQTYSDVLTTLQANYYGKDIDSQKMTYNAIRGMMGSLHDIYTRFMDPDDLLKEKNETQGVFVGIGAQLGTNQQGQTYVVRVLPGGSAFKYHVMAGDIILKVDGKSTHNLKDTDVVELIHGKPNTNVTLTLLRKSTAVVITMPRAVVKQEVVTHSMIDPVRKIGYISLSQFTEESDSQIEDALTDLQSQGVRGIILDLRDNPGGLLDIAERIASRFIPPGPVLWIKDKDDPMVPDNTDPTIRPIHLPLVVLVNGDSASAAEILSGAIKDTGAGILVGEQTFGKGVVQTIMNLADGSSIAITTDYYYTASKHNINHKGIAPNITVSFTDNDLRKLYAYLRSHPEAYYDLQDDRQLKTALAEVQQKMLANAKPG